MPISNVRWVGGEFESQKNATTGEYAPGRVIRIIGDDIWIEDVIVNGFGAADTATKKRGGIAIALTGDRIRVINPRVINPYRFNSAGIRVYGGTGFRCHGGSVDSGGDAALQFSTGTLDGEVSAGITDGAFLDTRCTSYDGRLMLVGTSDTPITGVRFERVSGEVTGKGDGECIRVQNNNGGDLAATGGAIGEIDFLDVRVKHGTTAARAVVISNDFDAPDKRVAGIRFGNLWIDTPSDVAFCTYSSKPAALGEEGPIQDVSWVSGGVTNPTSRNSPALSLERLTGGRFAGLRLAGGTNRPTVILGDTLGPLGVPLCQRVAFEDVVIPDVAEGVDGVKVDLAYGCTWSRGAVAEADAAHPADAAFRVTADPGPLPAFAWRLAVAGADTSGVTTGYRIDAATCTVAGGYGDRRRSAVQVGAAG